MFVIVCMYMCVSMGMHAYSILIFLEQIFQIQESWLWRKEIM